MPIGPARCPQNDPSIGEGGSHVVVIRGLFPPCSRRRWRTTSKVAAADMAETNVRTEAALRRALWGLNPAPGTGRSRLPRSCPRTAAGGCRSCAACRCALGRGHAACDRIWDRSGRRDGRPPATGPTLPQRLGRPTRCRCPSHDVSTTAGSCARSVDDKRSTQAIRPALQAGHRPRLSSAAGEPTSRDDSSPVVAAI